MEIARGLEEERGGELLMSAAFSSGMMKTFWKSMKVVVAQQWKYTECHRTVHLQRVQTIDLMYSLPQ